MLPTPPRGDAVPIGYKPESVYLKRTYTFLTKHTYKRTSRVSPRLVLVVIRFIGSKASDQRSESRGVTHRTATENLRLIETNDSSR
jgi:hypothetical protein